MKKIMAWLLCAVVLLGMTAGCGQEPEEVPEIPEETAGGKLVAFDGQTLQLDGAQGTMSFDLTAETAVELARGFVSGDDFTVIRQGEAVLSVCSEKAAREDEFTLGGTVSSVSADVLELKTEEGESFRFLIAGAALDLWQGLSKGIYVQVSGVGDLSGSSSNLWVKSVTDHTDGLLPGTEELPEEPAEGEEAVEAPEEEAEETPEEEAEETPAEELPWELSPAEDILWASANINLRMGPGMEYIRMAQIAAGTELARKGISGDWSLVQADGLEGYVQTGLLLSELPEQTFTIHYDAGEGVGAPADQFKILGQDMIVSTAQPVRSGYTFIGWNTSENGFGITLQPGDVYEMDGTATLYAQWREGETTPTPEPTPEPLAEGEEPASTPEPTPEPEPEPIADTSSALSGVIRSMDSKTLVLDLEGEDYEFDISGAALTAARGVHAGDAVTVYYAGTIGPGKDCSRAPAVCLAVEAGNALVEGVIAGLTADTAALELDGLWMFFAADTQGLTVGEEAAVTLKNEMPEGNLFAAAAIE